MKVLRICAVFFGLLALATFIQPLALPADTGFVFLGKRLSGAPNLIVSWSFALFLACYAAALWRGAAMALPLGIAYAGYLSVNLHYGILFSYRAQNNTEPLNATAVVLLAAAWSAVVAMLLGKLVARGPSPGRILLRSFALLFAVMALSNALKPFVYAPDIGLVFFGHRLAGTANVVGSLIFSALLALYAASIWMEKRRALVLGTAYALYVPTNILMWNPPEKYDMPGFMALPYLVGAIGVSTGAALLLWRRRKQLV